MGALLFRRSAHKRLAPGVVHFGQAITTAHVAIDGALPNAVDPITRVNLAHYILLGGLFVSPHRVPVPLPTRGSEMVPPWGCA